MAEKKVQLSKPKNIKYYIDLNPEYEKSKTIEENNDDDDKLSKRAKEILDAALEEEYLEEKIRPLSFAERIKRAQTMRRFASKIELAKERAATRRASPEKIRARARKKALEIIRNKVVKNKHYSDLSVSEKIAIDKRLMRIPQVVFDRIARKQLQIVKKADAERMQRRMQGPVSAVKSTVNESFDEVFGEVDLNEYFENFMEGKLNDYKTPQKRPHTIFNKTGSVKFDKRFKLFRKNVNESADVNELLEFADMMNTFEEDLELDRAKTSIQREKTADQMRHQRMIANAKRIDDSRKKNLTREETDITRQLINQEANHKLLVKALKDYAYAVKDMKYETKDKKEAIAKRIISKYNIDDFNHHDLMNLNRRVKYAKHYEKAYSNFDAED